MEIREDIPDHRLIMGCVRDAQIHLGMPAFQMIASGLYERVIMKAEARFMGSCEFGSNWAQVLEHQPLFGLDENDMPCFVKDGLVQPKIVVTAEPVPLTESAIQPD